MHSCLPTALFDGVSTAVDFTFDVGGASVECVDVVAADDEIVEDFDILNGLISADDTSVELFLFQSSFVLIDDDGN